MPHDPFYWSTEWRRFRASVLRDRPKCPCGARATHVDHIKTRASGGAPFDPANVQAMCQPHHASKTALRDGGFGNARGGKGRYVRRGCDASGRPLDGGHHWAR